MDGAEHKQASVPAILFIAYEFRAFTRRANVPKRRHVLPLAWSIFRSRCEEKIATHLFRIEHRPRDFANGRSLNRLRVLWNGGGIDSF